MNLDKVLIIPHLSKELTLIGHSSLPFSLQRQNGGSKIKKKSSVEVENDTVKIVFDSKKMLDALISVCFELVKQIKTLEFNCDSNEIDKVNFENVKLEKQLKLSKIEIEKKMDELASERETNRQFQVKVEQLEKQIKDCAIEKNKAGKNSLINENVLKHNLKKKDSDLIELHKMIWKKFNMTDRNFFPENFEIIQIDQPNFNKLWSDVKYSSTKNKEEILKKAVCIFQENNNFLMENNMFLKSLLLLTLEEINETTELILDKVHLNEMTITKDKIGQICDEVLKINIPLYKNLLNEHFSIIRKIFELIDNSSFSISGDLFICWSDVLRQAKDLNSHNIK